VHALEPGTGAEPIQRQEQTVLEGLTIQIFPGGGTPKALGEAMSVIGFRIMP